MTKPRLSIASPFEMGSHVLVVEDEAISARDLAEMLESIGHSVAGIADSVQCALSIAESECPDIALLDIRLGNSEDGIALGAKLRESYQLPLVFVSAHCDSETVARAVALKPNHYVVKPFRQTDIYIAIETALSNYAEEHAQLRPSDREQAKLQTEGLDGVRLTRVLDYMEKYFSRNLLLAELAEVAELSPAHFAVQFRLAVGDPPHRHMVRMRVEEAKRLLRTTAWSIAEVAGAVGYENSAYFATVFKRMVGTTPGAYRRKA